MHAFRLSGSPRAVAHLLGTVIICLLCAHIAGLIMTYGFGHDYVHGLVPLFNVDEEGNIPTFFAVCMALCAALLFAVIGLEAKHRASTDARYWLLLAAGFLFIAYDEGFQVHEKMMAPMRAVLGGTDLGILYFGWVVPGMIGVVAVGLFFLKFMLRIPALTRRRMLIAGGLFVGGCIGMELVGGAVMEAQGRTLLYGVIITIEETLELCGMATLLHAQVSHIADASDKVELDLHADLAQPLLPAVRPGFG